MLKPALVLVGIGLGIVLVWLSFRGTTFSAVSGVLSQANIVNVALASLIYFSAIFFRILRWRLLLQSLGVVTFQDVGRGLIIGFAMNFALPGRLGEIFRADVTKEISTISRTSALGAILIERAADGIILVGLLVASLLALHVGRNDTSEIPLTFVLSAGGVFAGAALAVFVLRQLKVEGDGLVSRLFSRFRSGLLTLNRNNVLRFAGSSVLIASLEVLAVGLMLSGLGLDAAAASAALVLSVASLSTLLPTAPAYLGSYQFALVLAFSVLQWPTAAAVATAFLIQLTFFVPVMIVGFVLGLQTYWRPVLRVAKAHGAPPSDRVL